MKKILSAILAMAIIAGVFVAGTFSPAAASKSAMPFKEGRIVSCGKYLFSLVQQGNTSPTCLYRTSKSGKSAKAISKKISGQKLFTYKSKLYYTENDKIMCYNAKTLKKSVFNNTKVSPEGICSKGLIAYDSEGIYLLKYSGEFEKIASQEYKYAGANKQYVFYTKTVDYNTKNHTAKLYMYRYKINSGESEKTGAFNSKNNSYENSYSNVMVETFRAFKNYNVFICGSYGGSAAVFAGDAFAMKADGTKIKKLKSDIGNKLYPGKNCIYISSNNCFYKVSSSAKISKKAKNGNDVYIEAATESNRSVTIKKAEGGSMDLYVNRSVSAKAQKKVISAASLIKSSYPSDAYIYPDIMGVDGDMILVRVRVLTYHEKYNPIGWRAGIIKTVNYLVNAKTGKKVKI